MAQILIESAEKSGESGGSGQGFHALGCWRVRLAKLGDFEAHGHGMADKLEAQLFKNGTTH